MKPAKRIAALRPRHILLGCFVVMSLLLTMLISQSNKLKEITREQQSLTAAYESLLLEEQRLSSMLEYSKTDEYLVQCAREKLGYVGPEDYKFYRDEPAE